MESLDYKNINKSAWNKRADLHFTSAFYDVDNFLKGKSSLNTIELELLGDVGGLSILHLQCHFGQDSLSLARMGAQVVGADISDQAIEKAQMLNQQLGLNAEFICCDLYDLPQHLDRQFDIVFTSYGTIGWLPDLEKWAEVIQHFLKPAGQLVFVEFHPVVWMFDDDFKEVAYSYFKSDPIIETTSGSYADRSAEVNLQSVSWNHSLGEVFQALKSQNLSIKDFQEYDYSPYDCFNAVEQLGEKKYIIAPLKRRIPMIYSIVAQK